MDEFIRQARAAGGTVHASSTMLAPTKDDEPHTEVVGFFYLKEWPYSSGSKKASKKLDILIRSTEIYEKDTLRLVKSTVQIMYFNAHTEEAVPTLGLHYDYEYKIGAAHPIFHAQLGSSSFSVQELADVKFDRVIQEWKDLVRVRIPTVHVGFPAAILSLFADHLPHDNFATFLSFAKTQHLFNDAKARIDCRSAPLNTLDSTCFQAHRLYS
ncbi:hypothetical protein LOY52_21705 [Pseudomonas sp. B21-051]|uniref:hypothetical protein n=1 Tax=Pseudomonas sp. B21-051 TaxID=2895491 RepID=UPI00215F3679|nr:hypothetical protein [Pseudomonas sp. B21-051]UVK87449.1 hypothetical protein LOY52_21705 [Pseudomonas sp. B21-051]